MRLPSKLSPKTTPRKTVSLTCIMVVSSITTLKSEEDFFCRGLNSIKFVLVKFKGSLFALNHFDSLINSRFIVSIKKSGSITNVNDYFKHFKNVSHSL